MHYSLKHGYYRLWNHSLGVQSQLCSGALGMLLKLSWASVSTEKITPIFGISCETLTIGKLPGIANLPQDCTNQFFGLLSLLASLCVIRLDPRANRKPRACAPLGGVSWGKDPGCRLRPIGAPDAPDRLAPPSTPTAPRSAAPCVSSSLVLGTGTSARVWVWRGARHSLGQPGPRAPWLCEAPAVATARARHWGLCPGEPGARRCRRQFVPVHGPLYYHAAVRGLRERRGENGGRDRPGRGIYQVSGRAPAAVARRGGRAAEVRA